MKKLLKNLLSTKTIWTLSRKKEEFREIKARIIKSNKLLLGIAVAFDIHYLNEHKALLNGALIYESTKRRRKTNIYFVRRNIHRLEKGMIMIPRKSVFGLRFILQTVQAYKVLISDLNVDRSEINWSYQVLKKYFLEVNSDHENYIKSKQIFKQLPAFETLESKIPYQEHNESTIGFSEFHLLNKNRKSVRWFEKKEVEISKIKKALEVSALSPSSCNRSPFRYVISNEDQELTKKIAEISAGTTGWCHNIPAIAVLVGQQRAFSNISNRHSIYVDGTLSVMPFILALETLGLSTCLINWSDNPKNEGKMKALISTENDEKVIISIAIGYRNKNSMVAFSQRKRETEISNFI